MNQITILGAGLAGTLMAIYLAKRGYAVEIYESRPDIRLTQADRGRSINLAMSCRGLTGLKGVGLMDSAAKLMVPMRARAIHEEGKGVMYQAFGRHHEEYINAIQRCDLNRLLLDETEKFPKVRIHFNKKILLLDVHKKLLHFEGKDGEMVINNYSRLIGADGAGSFVRETLYAQGIIDYSRNFLPHGYKELSIAPGSPEILAREHLHLWPRDSFLLLGNPNRDHSITGSLFLPLEGKNSFAELDNESAVRAFCKKAFPDAYDAMPSLQEDFFYNPVGNMSTISCSPWHFKDHCMLIGDAAHGVVPFFGQGMNSAFEDCRILNELLERHEDDWEIVMPTFYQVRKKNTDAVAQMSLENYHEIQTDIRNEQFNFKKKLEQVLMHRYPERYISKHVLVMFTNTPYARALTHGELQNELLTKIFLQSTSLETIDWLKVDILMDEYDKKLTKLAV